MAIKQVERLRKGDRISEFVGGRQRAVWIDKVEISGDEVHVEWHDGSQHQQDGRSVFFAGETTRVVSPR